MKPEYSGCRSWVSIDEEIDIDGSLPALSDEDARRADQRDRHAAHRTRAGVELTVIIIMLAAGVGLAASVIITFAAAQREADMSGATRAKAAPDRNHIAASLLFNLLVCGGTPPDAAMRDDPQECGPRRAGHVVDRHHQLGRALREAGHARAAHVAPRHRRPAGRRPHHARSAAPVLGPARPQLRPRLPDRRAGEAARHLRLRLRRPRQERAAARAPTAAASRRRSTRATTASPPSCFASSASRAPASRAIIIAAYRKLAAQHHPDKVFGEPAEVQNAAAARFIEITQGLRDPSGDLPANRRALALRRRTVYNDRSGIRVVHWLFTEHFPSVDRSKSRRQHHIEDGRVRSR